MKLLTEIKAFLGSKMNLDATEISMKKNEYGEAFNFRNYGVSVGHNGIGKGIPGNYNIPFTSPSGTNRIVGNFKVITNDPFMFNGNRLVILFLYNSQHKHSILAYDVVNNVVSYIVKEKSFLNFRYDKKINNAYMVGGILFFNDSINQPRCINVKRALYYVQNGNVDCSYYLDSITYYIGNRVLYGNHIFECIQSTTGNPPDFVGNNEWWIWVRQWINNAYLSMNDVIISRIKPKPLPVIDPHYIDQNSGVNMLLRKFFHFAYRYIYFDNQISAFSEISPTCYPIGEVDSDGYILESHNRNNAISFNIHTGNSDVKEIEIAVNSGIEGIWKIFKKIIKHPNVEDDPTIVTPFDSVIEIIFNNSYIGVDVENSEVLRPFDYVPLIVKRSELIGENRIVDSNYLTGYDNTTIDISLSLVHKKVNLTADIYYQGYSYTIVLGGFIEYRISFKNIPHMIGYTYEIMAKNVFFDGNYHVSSDEYIKKFKIVMSEANAPTSILIEEFKAMMIDFFSSFNNFTSYRIYIYETPDPENEIYLVIECMWQEYMPVLMNFTVYKFDFDKHLSFKGGERLIIGILYSDDFGRTGMVNISDESQIAIPSIGTKNLLDLTATTPLITDNSYKTYLKFTINHIPPSWARYWEIVFTRFVNYFQVFIINSAQILIGDEYGIQINENIDVVYDDRKDYVHKPYTWVKGDRLRYIGKRGTITGAAVFFENQYDVEITNAENNPETGVYLIYHQIINLPIIVSQHYIIEIYRPRNEGVESSENYLFYRRGKKYNVLNPFTGNRVHEKGDDDGSGYAQDQTTGSGGDPCKGVLMDGDCFIKAIYNTTLFIGESMHYSDFYNSKYFPKNISLSDASNVAKMLVSGFVYSGLYIPNTLINDLCRVDYLNTDYLSDSFGEIRFMVEIGYTLKIIQDTKCTSIYIGRAGLSQASADGIDVVATTNEILGTKFIHEERYGTLNPESCLVVDRNLYFFDSINFQLIRWASNGLFPVSKYGVESEFKSIGNIYNDDPATCLIHLGYDPIFNDIWFHFQRFNPDHQNYVCMIYRDEPFNEWKTKVNLIPYLQSNMIPIDGFTTVGDVFLCFANGKIYKQNFFQDYNIFFGAKHPSTIELYFNNDVVSNKIFKSISIDCAGGNWSMPEIGDVAINENSFASGGMYSRLKDGSFRVLNGERFAQFLRDAFTGGALDVNDLYAGRELTGKILIVKLTISENDISPLSEIKTVKINYLQLKH